MNSNELRIGNFVELSGSPERIASINSDKTIRLNNSFDKEHGCYRIGKIKPIPITGEWLLRFGFEKRGNKFYLLKFLLENGISILDKSMSFRITTSNSESTHAASIKYVHQLQNLYFALTGTELECAP